MAPEAVLDSMLPMLRMMLHALCSVANIHVWHAVHHYNKLLDLILIRISWQL